MVSRGKIFSKDQKKKKEKGKKPREGARQTHVHDSQIANCRLPSACEYVTYIVWYGYNTPFILPR